MTFIIQNNIQILTYVGIVIAAAILATPLGLTYAVDNNFRAYWDFDKPQGSFLNDRTDNSLDLTVSANPPSMVSGKFHQAADFDGVNDYADTDTTLGLNPGTESFTAACWINPDNINNLEQRILSQRDGSGIGRIWFYLQGGNNQLTTFLTGATLSSGVVPPQDTWTHVALVKTELATDNTKLYVDGIEKANSNANVSTNADGVMRFGASKAIAPAQFYNGQVDDCLIIKRALSANEIAAIHHMGAGGSNADQIKYKSYDTPEGVTFTSHHTANTVHISIASGLSSTKIYDVTVDKVKPPPKNDQPGCSITSKTYANSDKSVDVELDCSEAPDAKSVKLDVTLTTGDKFSVNVNLQ